MQVLSDAPWGERAPLIEGVRPKGKTRPQALRRTIAAIFWRHGKGAKGRALPGGLGPWPRAAQRFIRPRPSADGRGIRAHGKAAGAAGAAGAAQKGAMHEGETAVSVAPLRAAMAAAVAALGRKPA